MKIITTDNPDMKTGNRAFQKFIFKSNFLLGLFMLILLHPAFAQAPKITADTVMAHLNDSIDVAVRAYDMPQIGSITLYIQITGSVLDYGRALDINPLIIPGNPLINKINSNTIAVSWYDINGVTIGTDKILDLRFKYKGGTSQIAFLANCEITDIGGDLLVPNVTYLNGLVFPSVSVNIHSSVNGICAGDSVLLTAQASNGQGNYTYSWSSDPPGFSSAQGAVWVKPTVNTTYTVEVSDGIDTVSASKAIEAYSNTPPSSVTNMLPADSSFNISFPIHFSWSPSVNASSYDLYIWKYDVTQPSVPAVSNITQISYQLNASGLFSFGDTCKWKVVARSPCAQTAGPIQLFSVRGLPELHVTGITNSTPIAGQPMTISWTVQNDGDGETPAGNVWMDRVWLAPDIEVRIGESEDILLGQFPNVSYLSPGQNYVQTQQIQIPANLIGTYFIFVVTDALDACLMNWPISGPPLPYNPPPYYRAYSHGGSYVNVVQEISDAMPYQDNFFYKEIAFPIPPEPDLKVTSIIPPSNVFSGQAVNLTWSVKNNGDGNTSTSNWSDRVYLTKDSVLNTSTAYNLGTFSHTGILNPDSIYTCTHSITIPSNIYGIYYFYITTDISNNVFEYVYENNNTTRSDTLTIFLTPPADLVVTGINMPDTINSKDVFTVGWTVENQGASSPAVNSWADNVFLSYLPYFDYAEVINLGSKSITMDSLNPDSSYTASKQITFSQNITGAYYVYVKTDKNNNVFEYVNENNNVLRSDAPLIVVNPDLVAANIVCPPANINSQPFNVQWTVKNNGPGKIFNQAWKDKILVSRSQVYQPDSVVLIAEQNHISSLLTPGDSLNQDKLVSMPDSLSGSYYLYIYTDGNNNVYENGYEYNNISRSAGTIQLYKPDLAVSDIIIPPVDSGALPVNIRWKVKNVGTGVVYNRNWTDRVMISHNPVYDPDSVFQIAALNYDAYLNPGDSIIKEMFVSLPDSTIPGTYYVFILLDYFDEVFENYSEANNLGQSALAVQILRPDLIVKDLLIPSSANSGEPVSIQWTTKNIGTSSILNASWNDRIFISPYPSYSQGSNVFLGDKAITTTMQPGDSLVNQMTALIPEGFQGDYYLHIFTDFGNNIEEFINENNNVDAQLIHLVISSWADLRVMNITLNDSAMAGSNIPLNFTVKNTGTKNIINKSWIDEVYISSSLSWDSASSIYLRSFSQSRSLAIDSSYEIISDVNLPAGLSEGNYYLYVYTDKTNLVFEHTTEYNNVLRSENLYINPLPPVDLTVLDVINPDSANSGQTINIQWTVKNLANANTVLSWFDAVYLSSDSIWDENTDIYIGKRTHYGQLGYDMSYNGSQAFNLPNGISGDYYLLVVADYEQVNNDNHFSNNWKSRTVTGTMMITHITLTPPPDLQVTELLIPMQAITSIPFNVVWTVQNQGVGDITNSTWTDKIYLSSDLVINTGDVLIGTKTRNASLGISQMYTDSLAITLPNNLSGNYIIIIITDFGNTIFEANENNNTDFSFIVLSQPPPADLFITDVIHQDSVIVGKSTTIQWILKNTGQNPANGSVKDMVYFSEDATWDINDVLFGSYQSAVSLGPDAEITRSLTAKANDLRFGYYFVIVKSDVLNGIFETDENNNSSPSDLPLFADVRELPIGGALTDTLNDLENLYFRIPVDYSQNDETMLTTLKADSLSGSNEMYLTHDDMPTRITYDYSSGNPYQGNQEIIVPSVEQGNYYMLLYGSTLVGNSQLVDVRADILIFQILSLNPATGGNTGQVTLEIIGSKFDPDMLVQLKNGATTITANDIMYVNYSKVYATFDLTGIQPGVFDLVLEKLNGDMTSFQDGFQVVSGTPTELGVYVIAPPSARANRVTSFTIEFANLGNTNIYDPKVIVKSLTISPIALTVDELVNMDHELVVPFEEENGPSGILRPGVTGTITIYTKTIAGLGFIIEY